MKKKTFSHKKAIAGYIILLVYSITVIFYPAVLATLCLLLLLAIFYAVIGSL